MMSDVIAILVACIALWGMLERAIPTGIMGSLGLAMIGGSALIAVDDSSFANTQRLEVIVSALLLGFLLIVAHVAFIVWKANTGKLTPRRRSTDLGELDESEQRHIVGGMRE
jgi:xanthine/uracil permease